MNNNILLSFDNTLGSITKKNNEYMLVLIDHEGLLPFVSSSIKETANKLIELYDNAIIGFDLKFNFSIRTPNKIKKKIKKSIICRGEVNVNYFIRLLILL